MTSPIPMFYLGTLGKMVPLASPDRDIERSVQFVGQEHTSLDGSTTMDVRGYRREWRQSLVYLDQRDLSYLQMARFGELGAPLRFLDPVNKNRLTESSSLCSNQSQYAGGRYNWASSSGLVSRITGTGQPVTYTGLDGRAVSFTPGRFMQWVPTGSGFLAAEIKYLSSVTYTDLSAPVLPNEVLTLSIYAKKTAGAGNFSLSLLPVTAPDTFGTAVTSSTSTSSSWVRLTVNYTVPASGVIAVAFQLNSSAAGTIQLTQAQLENGSSATDWVVGGGVGEVLIRELSEVSPIHPLVTASVTVRER
jgi:hypothetical protein